MSITVNPSRQTSIDSINEAIAKLELLKAELENTDDYERCNCVLLINSPKQGFRGFALASRLQAATMINRAVDKMLQ